MLDKQLPFGSFSHLLLTALVLSGFGTTLLHAQSQQRAVFVANDGNLEGSVTSFTVAANGVLTFVEKFIIDSTPSTQMPVPGTNAHAISLTPDGRFLAVGHATGADDFEQLTILRVNPDATLGVFATFQVPDSPFALTWVDDSLLAITKTTFAGTNQIQIFLFSPNLEVGSPTLTLVDTGDTGSFTTYLDLHPSGNFIYGQSSSGGNSITGFGIDGGGLLTFIETVSTGITFPLGIAITHDGKHIYGCGGISSGGNAIIGYAVSGDGTLQVHGASPYTSPGSSPAQITFSQDDLFAFAGHGTDATIQSFDLDDATGALTANGFSFDVGFQGSLGEIEVAGDLLFALDRDTISDGLRGIYSFTVNANGSLTQNGPILDTLGSRPNELAAWPAPDGPLCPEDLNNNGNVDGDDLAYALERWSTGDLSADVNGDGSVDILDLAEILAAFGACL